MTKKLIFGCVIWIGTLLCSCGERQDNIPPADTLLVGINGRYLTIAEVEEQTPQKLSKADSLAFVNTFVEQWIEDQLLFENAEKNIPNLKYIDQLVEQYRRQLIMFEYQKQLINQRLLEEISEADVQTYYEEHPLDFTLNSPIIKGLYLKVPQDAPQIDQVKKWYRSNTPQAIENIEKYSLKNAISYEYFYDKWIPFAEVMDNIPYAISNEKGFLRTHSTLEVNENGFWYFLNISEYLVEGAVEPLDFAQVQIREILINKRKRKFIQTIEDDLYQTALRKDKIDFYQWSPVADSVVVIQEQKN